MQLYQNASVRRHVVDARATLASYREEKKPCHHLFPFASQFTYACRFQSLDNGNRMAETLEAASIVSNRLPSVGTTFISHTSDERIARFPVTPRDSSKLLVYKKGEISEQPFTNLPALLPENAFD